MNKDRIAIEVNNAFILCLTLIQLRREAGMKEEEVAKYLNVDSDMVRAIEKGEETLSVVHLDILVNLYESSINEFFNRYENYIRFLSDLNINNFSMLNDRACISTKVYKKLDVDDLLILIKEE